MLSALIPLASFLALARAGYETYPSVAKTASINGFADKIYDQLPSCAQSCVKESTSSTPCPYWDTGCLCVISTFASNIADCIAENCAGSDVQSAGSLATSLCSSAGVGAPYWYIDGSASSALAAAEAKTPAATTTAADAETTTAAETAATTTTPANAETSSAITTAATASSTEAGLAQTQTTSAAVTQAPSSAETTAAPASSATGNTQTTEKTSAVETPVSSVSSAATSSAPSVSSAYNAAAGVAPGIAAGVLAGIALLV